MRRVLPVLLFSACAHSGAGGGFPELMTRPLPGSLEAQKKWSWPEPADFEESWQRRRAAPAVHSVLSGELAAYEHRWYDSASGDIKSEAVPDWSELEAKARHAERGCRGRVWALDVTREGQRRLQPLTQDKAWCTQQQWEVVKAVGPLLYLRTEDAVAALNLRTTSAPLPLPDEYLADWTYVATLLAPRGKSAQLLAEYEKTAPMGRCSMDTRPASFAREFAQRCFAAGELACFLQVHLRVVGDQFNRVAASSMGERASPTDAVALEKAGIDTDRFFRGLVVMMPEHRPSELSPSRLARALLESGRQASFEPLLEKMLQDPRLDTYSRFRAFAVYVSMHYRADGDDAPMKAKVNRLSLDELSAAWWTSLGK